MSKTRKFITAVIIETLAVVAIFYALGVARGTSLTAEDADGKSTEVKRQEAPSEFAANRISFEATPLFSANSSDGSH